MEYLIGVTLSLAVAAFASIVGFDRDRAYFPTVMIVIAAYYVLFAAMGGSGRAVVFEIIAASVFVLVAVVGYKWSLWLVAVALVGHGVFDFFHHWLIEDPGVPRWWPAFCGIFDVIFGGLAAVRLLRRDVAVR